MAALAGVGLELEREARGPAAPVVVVAGCVHLSPAALCGAIRSGDVLLSVDGLSVGAQPLEQIRGVICGRPGSLVRLAFRRPPRGPGAGGAGQIKFEVVLERGRPAAPPQRAALAAPASYGDALDAASVGAGARDGADHELLESIFAAGQGEGDSTFWASAVADLPPPPPRPSARGEHRRRSAAGSVPVEGFRDQEPSWFGGSASLGGREAPGETRGRERERHGDGARRGNAEWKDASNEGFHPRAGADSFSSPSTQYSRSLAHANPQLHLHQQPRSRARDEDEQDAWHDGRNYPWERGKFGDGNEDDDPFLPSLSASPEVQQQLLQHQQLPQQLRSSPGVRARHGPEGGQRRPGDQREGMGHLHARDKDVTHSPSRVAMASASGDAQVYLSSRSPFICIRFLLPMDLVSYKIVLRSELPKW
jgi:hypothetical protein